MEAGHDGSLAPRTHGDHVADRDCASRVLYLQQQSDPRALRPGEQVGKADEARVRRLDLGGDALGNQSIPDDGQIMADDQHTIARALDVAFDCVGPLGARGLEGCPAVVGVRVAASSMRDDLHGRHCALRRTAPRA